VTIDPANTKRVFGLFNESYMQYEADRHNDIAGESSLSEMTAKAIDVPDNKKKGHFLMVESGRIDHSHVFTIAGYPKRGSPIPGKVVGVGQTEPSMAADGMPYTTLGYTNGLGFRFEFAVRMTGFNGLFNSVVVGRAAARHRRRFGISR